MNDKEITFKIPNDGVIRTSYIHRGTMLHLAMFKEIEECLESDSPQCKEEISRILKAYGLYEEFTTGNPKEVKDDQ